MTVWIGVGLIFYIHFLFFVVVYLCFVAFQRLKAQLHTLSANLKKGFDEAPSALASRLTEASLRAGEPLLDPAALRRRVFDLASEGAEAPEIAAETKMPRADVNFLIKLSRTRTAKARGAAS